MQDAPVDELIARWSEQIDSIADALHAFGEHRPPLDCHTHEHDVRHAVGRSGKRDSELIDWMVELFSQAAVGRPIDVMFTDGTSVPTVGDGDVVRLTDETKFDLARSRLGRRSRSQVRSWNWSSPLTDDELDAWFSFGPTEHDIVE